jgi:hypothetical protein
MSATGKVTKVNAEHTVKWHMPKPPREQAAKGARPQVEGTMVPRTKKSWLRTRDNR